MLIIDAHSHIGNDFFHGKSNLNAYITLMQNSGVKAGLLMSVPSPVYYENGEKKVCFGWEYKDKFIYHGSLNPYEEANNFVYNSIKENNSPIKLFYVMVVHPLFDSLEYIRNEIETKSPIALKIHGVSCGISVQHMSVALTNLIKEYDIPVIVHTDYDNGKTDLPYFLHYTININNARYWAQYFNENQIRGILNHGCSLDSVACDIVNHSPYLKVGLGPDYLNNQDISRLNIDPQEVLNKGYLRLLKEKLMLSKILFDVDYNWNEKLDSAELDLEFVERIKAMWSNRSEQELIFAENLIQHIPLLSKKI